MYLINTSFFVDPATQEEWLAVMHGSFIPSLRSEGYAIVAFSRVISMEAADHFTYSLLVEAADLEDYSRLTDDVFGHYQSTAGERFGEKVLTFSTLMKKIKEDE